MVLQLATTILKGEEQFVGCCGYSWHLGLPFGVLDYDLARCYWKQGIMTEAVQALLRFGFEVRNLHRVEARVRLGNEASMRLLQRLGFQEEGRLRECLFLNNHFFDVKIFSRLKSEYRKSTSQPAESANLRKSRIKCAFTSNYAHLLL